MGQERKWQGFREATLNHIITITGLNRGQIKTIVSELLADGWDKNRIYQQLTNGDGVRKSHASVKGGSDKLKDGFQKTSQRNHHK